jgi:hypothetical protein
MAIRKKMLLGMIKCSALKLSPLNVNQF